jgi:hypothetical protein
MEMEQLLYTVATIVLGWLGWQKRVNLASFAKTIGAKLSTLVSSQPKSERSAAQPSAPRAAGAEVNETAETVVVHRGTFGSITCVAGVLLGQRWDIPGHGLSIGRDPASDVVINDSRVSVKHAQIRPKQGDVMLVDAGSTNGVFLNDVHHRVTGEAALKPGDLVILSTTDAAQFIYRK